MHDFRQPLVGAGEHQAAHGEQAHQFLLPIHHVGEVETVPAHFADAAHRFGHGELLGKHKGKGIHEGSRRSFRVDEQPLEGSPALSREGGQQGFPWPLVQRAQQIEHHVGRQKLQRGCGPNGVEQHQIFAGQDGQRLFEEGSEDGGPDTIQQGGDLPGRVAFKHPDCFLWVRLEECLGKAFRRAHELSRP